MSPTRRVNCVKRLCIVERGKGPSCGSICTQGWLLGGGEEPGQQVRLAPAVSRPECRLGAALPLPCWCVSLQEPWWAAASALSGWEGVSERASLSEAPAGRLGVLDGNPSTRMGWGHLVWGRERELAGARGGGAAGRTRLDARAPFSTCCVRSLPRAPPVIEGAFCLVAVF